MKQGFNIVPFKIDDEHGFSESIGLAKFSAAGIVLEFEKEILGMVKAGGVREARIPLTDILDLQFSKGFLGFFRKIVIRFKNLGAIAGLPSKNGRLKMKVARADHAAAERAVEELQNLLNRTGTELPPASVRQLFSDEAQTRDLKDTNEL